MRPSGKAPVVLLDSTTHLTGEDNVTWGKIKTISALAIAVIVSITTESNKEIWAAAILVIWALDNQ